MDYPIFRRKIYSKIKAWKEKSAGKTAYLSSCVYDRATVILILCVCYSSFRRVSMSSSVVDQSVTNLTMDSSSPLGPQSSNPTSFESLSIK